MHNRLTTRVNNGTGCARHTDFAMDLFSFMVHGLLLRLRCYESSVLTQASLDAESSDAVSTVWTRIFLILSALEVLIALLYSFTHKCSLPIILLPQDFIICFPHWPFFMLVEIISLIYHVFIFIGWSEDISHFKEETFFIFLSQL